ncbi:oncoprotein-induced transcript 3 protein-like isoform X2 [Leucoraja erinacea]|uniref:oncoprotein-induced transcript 3 protein-like isoform X2 n=1 Tax=Leucoraja erinaceus TaxID=7782 RepID=UPI002453A39B|nr:oncoprotein-induced transcript 3 protein-like isoform X2 [Leucoraja erinacea]
MLVTVGLEKSARTSWTSRLKNCSSYFVYELKPTHSDQVYCTAADSALGDPCVNHTVLDQPWRSTDCTDTECSNGQWQNDEKHGVGWYRFKSSGGWKIPETVVPTHHCSGTSPGWLNGSHPSVGDGEVNRTVCFTWDGNNCNRQQEIKVKHCGGFFVYRLEPTLCCDNVYCTDPHSVPTGESQETTAQPQEDLSKVPEPDTSSGPEGAGTEAHKKSTTREPSGTPSTAPKEETCSAPWLLTEKECERLISEAQVLFIGDQGSPEDMNVYLQELREILRKQLYCK